MLCTPSMNVSSEVVPAKAAPPVAYSNAEGVTAIPILPRTVASQFTFPTA